MKKIIVIISIMLFSVSTYIYADVLCAYGQFTYYCPDGMVCDGEGGCKLQDWYFIDYIYCPSLGYEVARCVYPIHEHYCYPEYQELCPGGF